MGSNFIRYWMDRHPGDAVVNFDILTYAGNLENLREVEADRRYRFVKGDITDANAVREAIAGSEAVAHFAAETHVDRSIMSPAAFVRTNILGTQVLLDAAREVGVERFVQISTDEVFGPLELEDERRFSEKTPYAPSSPYAASKAGADWLVESFIRTYHFPASITHSGNNYGPYQFPEKLVSLAITHALQGKPVPVYGDGRYVRSWVYVDDHSAAVEAVLLRGRPGERYVIGGEERSNLELVREIVRLSGQDESLITFVKDRPGHDRRYALDSSKIRQELGWRPRTALNEGLARTVEWYRLNTGWRRRVLTKEYLDYYQKQYAVAYS